MEPQIFAFGFLSAFAAGFVLLAIHARFSDRFSRQRKRADDVADQQSMAETRRQLLRQAAEE